MSVIEEAVDSGIPAEQALLLSMFSHCRHVGVYNGVLVEWSLSSRSSVSASGNTAQESDERSR